MSATDDVTSGLVCMQCHGMLISADGVLNESGCPTLCYECWLRAPVKERKNGLPYFEELTGELVTKEFSK